MGKRHVPARRASEPAAGCLDGVPGAIDGHSHLFRDAGYAGKLIQAAETLGIRRICVSGLGKAFNMSGNRDVLAQAGKHPDRLIPFCAVFLGRDSPQKIVQAKRDGFRGIKFSMPLFPYDDTRAWEVYEKVEELGLPAHFHCGVVAYAPGVFTSSDYMRPMRLDGLARRFPGMRMLISHLGVPEYEVATTLARIVPNIYVDMTGSPRWGWYCSKTPQFIRSLFYWPGWHHRLIFGTDVRAELLPQAVRIHRRLLRAMRLSAEMKSCIYRDNFREFLGELAPRGHKGLSLVTQARG